MEYLRKIASSRQAVSLSRVKEHLRVVSSEEDSLIAGYIDAATSLAERYAGRAFSDSVWRLVRDEFPDYAPAESRSGSTGTSSRIFDCVAELPLGIGPVSTVVVTYSNAAGVSTTMPTADYFVGSERGVLAPKTGVWPDVEPFRPEAVTVDFQVVGTAISEAAVSAILLIVGSLYEYRGGDQLPNTTSAVAEREIPAAARSLLRSLSTGVYS